MDNQDLIKLKLRELEFKQRQLALDQERHELEKQLTKIDGAKQTTTDLTKKVDKVKVKAKPSRVARTGKVGAGDTIEVIELSNEDEDEAEVEVEVPVELPVEPLVELPVEVPVEVPAKIPVEVPVAVKIEVQVKEEPDVDVGGDMVPTAGATAARELGPVRRADVQMAVGKAPDQADLASTSQSHRLEQPAGKVARNHVTHQFRQHEAAQARRSETPATQTFQTLAAREISSPQIHDSGHGADDISAQGTPAPKTAAPTRASYPTPEPDSSSKKQLSEQHMSLLKRTADISGHESREPSPKRSKNNDNVQESKKKAAPARASKPVTEVERSKLIRRYARLLVMHINRDQQIPGAHRKQVESVGSEINGNTLGYGYTNLEDLHAAYLTMLGQSITDGKLLGHLYEKLLPFSSAAPQLWAECIALPSQTKRLAFVEKPVKEIKEGKLDETRDSEPSQAEQPSEPPNADDSIKSEAMFVDEGLGVEPSNENRTWPGTETENF